MKDLLRASEKIVIEKLIEFYQAKNVATSKVKIKIPQVVESSLALQPLSNSIFRVTLPN